MPFEVCLARAVLEASLDTPLVISALTDIAQAFREKILLPLTRVNLLSSGLETIFDYWATQHGEDNEFTGALLPDYSKSFLVNTLEGRLMLLVTFDETLKQASLNTVTQTLQLMTCLSSLSFAYIYLCDEKPTSPRYTALIYFLSVLNKLKALHELTPELSAIAKHVMFAHETYCSALRETTHSLHWNTHLLPAVFDDAHEKAQRYYKEHQQWTLPKHLNTIVLSGTPSSGKTTIAKLLKTKCFEAPEEAARTCIRKLIHAGENIERVIPTAAFTTNVAERNMQIENKAGNRFGRLTVIDCPLMDIYPYLTKRGISLPPELEDSVQRHIATRRHRLVFELDPLPFKQDGFRTETEEERMILHRLFKQTHARFDYSGIPVPRFSDTQTKSITSRVKFILDYVRQVLFLRQHTAPPFSIIPAQQAGKIFALAGPSGVGKTSIIKGLINSGIVVKLVCYTTREPRRGEVNGKDYHFVSKEDFGVLIRDGKLLVHLEIEGNYYGFQAADLYAKLRRGHSVILDLTPEALQMARARLPEEIKAIFVHPPDLHSLRQRLEHREKEPETVIKRFAFDLRMLGSLDFSQYHFHVINRVLRDSIQLLESIIHAGAPLLPISHQKNVQARSRFGFFLPESSSLGFDSPEVNQHALNLS